MSALAEILDRLSGIASLKERVAETNRHFDKTLTWLLDHEKRLIHLEMARAQPAAAVPALPAISAPVAKAGVRRRRLPDDT